MKWTPEKDTKLIEMSEDGLAEETIAEALGTSKNAVRSRRHRLRVRKGEVCRRPFMKHGRVIRRSLFGKILYPLLYARQSNIADIAVRTGFSPSLIYGATTDHPARTISKFATNCVADALELSDDQRQALLIAIRRDKLRYGKEYTK